MSITDETTESKLIHHSPEHPSDVAIKCVTCNSNTTTGLCGDCAQELCEGGSVSYEDAVRWLETGEQSEAVRAALPRLSPPASP